MFSIDRHIVADQSLSNRSFQRYIHKQFHTVENVVTKSKDSSRGNRVKLVILEIIDRAQQSLDRCYSLD